MGLMEFASEDELRTVTTPGPKRRPHQYVSPSLDPVPFAIGRLSPPPRGPEFLQWLLQPRRLRHLARCAVPLSYPWMRGHSSAKLRRVRGRLLPCPEGSPQTGDPHRNAYYRFGEERDGVGVGYSDGWTRSLLGQWGWPDWAEDDSEVLPPGFGTRTMGCGVVNLGWAPQLDILAHHAIGGCMFHAGWSTLIETVHFGHGLVFLPFSAVQKLDARMAVGKGIGLEVERGGDGMFHRDAVARSLRRTMVGEEGERLRLRSRELMAVFCDRRLDERFFSGFVDFLVSFRSK
ncbi:hypothetical protein MRB53_011784 [Persea americana]|uniref:Uncharacterized protein n=1 Tax=Persea americana TaxID=3435 RepID=A0ACC2LX51_PERAE|nr:hypothetical protein MRB53_011784 [Persea americana]